MAFTKIVSSQTVTGEIIENNLHGSSQLILSDGVAINTIIFDNSSQLISSGGTAISTYIEVYGYQYVLLGGTANYTYIDSGSQIVASGGVANSTTISGGTWYVGRFLNNSGGSQYVSYGGVASNTALLGGTQYVEGLANSTTINSGGSQSILSGGVANYTTINSGGYQNDFSGVANSTTINSGGHQDVCGVANSTTINSGGHQDVCGVANSTTINSGGYQNVYATGRLISGHAQTVGGVANSTTISGGTQYVSSGCVARNTVISGGSQSILSGGVASNTIISGGNMVVDSGGIVSNALTVAGGHVILANATSFNSLTTVSYVLTTATTSDVLITVNGGTLGTGVTAYSLNLDNTAVGSYILADGVNLSYMKSMKFSVTDNNQTVNVNVGSSYTFSNGDKLSLNFNDSTRDQLTAAFTVDTTPPSIPSGLNKTITGNSVALTWNDSTDADSGVKQYEVQVDNNSNFSSPEYSATPTASTATVNNLVDGTYYWEVRTQDNAGNYSAWSSGSSFTMDTSAPSAPATLTRTVTGNNVALDWIDATDNLSGVKQYEVQVDNNSNFSSPEYSATPTASTATVNSLVDGTYYWRIRTQDNSGNYSDWTTGNSFVVDTTAPAPATLTRTVTGSDITFDWADATDGTSGIKQYQIMVDNNADFSSPEYSSAPVSSTATSTNLADGNYYWRVCTQDNSGNYSAWTTGSNFTVDVTAPAVPASLTNIVTGSSVALDWADATDATSGVKNYLFQYATNAQFTGATQSMVTVSNANVSNLSDGTFYWRVQTTDNSGNASAWTSGSSFMVDVTAPTVPAALTRTVTGSGVALDWADATDATSGVKQYQVQVDNNTDFSSPEYSAQVAANEASVANLAAGTYSWHVRTEDNSGNWSAWSTAANFIVDLTPPTVPSGLKQTVTGSSVTLDWADSTDANGIKQYEVRFDNNNDFSSPEYSTVVDVSEASTSLALGTYYWQARAQDKSGNYSAWSSSSKFIVTPTDTAANTWQAAQDISNLDNWVGFGDTSDYYKLTMANSGMLTLGLAGLSGNADLSLLNSAGTVLKTSSNTGTTPEAISKVALLAGTYYVKVAAGYGVNDANYTLTHTEKYTPADKAANDYKTALDISTLDNWVGFGDSADFYKLTMTNAGSLSIGLAGLSGNADLSLLNSAGTVLKTSAKTGTADDSISNVLLLAGTYYVKVAAGTGVNDANYTLSHTEKYTPTDTGANTWQTAGDVSNLDNWVGFGDAADVYKLTMTNAGMLTLGLTGLTGNADLSLLNSAGTALKTSSNTGTTPEAITNIALLAGTYYVKVAAGYGVNDASYNLTNTVKYCPADKAANDYKTAQDISTLDNWVGFGDAADFYKLTMTNAGTLTLGLTGLTGNADLSLLNSAGTAIKTSANTGITREAINNVSLLSGTYYVKVAAGYGVNDASYNLTNTVSYFPGDTSDKAGNTLATAKLIDAPTKTGWVGFGDTDDYYRFDLATAAIGTLRLHDMTGGNADLTLYNVKGIQLKKSASLGVLEDTITSTLAAGTYYARVNAVSGNIDYKLDFSKKDIVSGMLAS